MNLGTQMAKEGRLAHLRTLDDVVDFYIATFRFSSGVERSDDHHDPIVDMCKHDARDLAHAVDMAVEGRRRDGKVFSEGSCLRKSSKEAFKRSLLSTGLNDLRIARDFDAIYDVVRLHAPWGIGNTTIYNVAARIAAHRGFHPENYLYVHAGPLKGWKALTRTRGTPYRIPMGQVPEALKRLPPHKIEDLLCEMRDTLRPEMMRE